MGNCGLTDYYKSVVIPRVAQEARKEGYEEGLNNAWECAKKLRHMDYSMLYKVFDGDNVVIHGIQMKGLEAVFEKYSASEAMAKIKEYEEKQKQTDDDGWIDDDSYIDKDGDRLIEAANKYQKIKQRIADYEEYKWERIDVKDIREIIDGNDD